MGETATGRPKDPMPLIPRLVVAVGLSLALLELSIRLLEMSNVLSGPGGVLFRAVVTPLVEKYAPIRSWVLHHEVLSVVAVVSVLGALAVAIRYGLMVWHNEFKARLTGTYFSPEVSGFPMQPVDVL